MKAMVLHQPGSSLRMSELPEPTPGPHDVRLRVRACAVCRTDLHLIDGDLTPPRFPVVPGHEVVGTVESVGRSVTDLQVGERVGVPWLGWTCGECPQCAASRENLCERARFTGFHQPGGFAEQCLVDARYAVRIPAGYDDISAAPLLCAGLIGYRTYSMAGPASRLGLYGFGAAAHLLCQLAVADGRSIYAFTRPGDVAAQEQARRLGAVWAGGSDEAPPEPLDAALIFAPLGELVPIALGNVSPGGSVVCGGIHMSDIPSFPYRLLWEERSVRSVANLTRQDGIDFMEAANRTPLRVEAHPYPLAEANRAVEDLRAGRINGAAVLTPP